VLVFSGMAGQYSPGPKLPTHYNNKYTHTCIEHPRDCLKNIDKYTFNLGSLLEVQRLLALPDMFASLGPHWLSTMTLGNKIFCFSLTSLSEWSARSHLAETFIQCDIHRVHLGPNSPPGMTWY